MKFLVNILYIPLQNKLTSIPLFGNGDKKMKGNFIFLFDAFASIVKDM